MIQYATRWFRTEAEFDAWKDTLDLDDQLTAELFAHVGHTPMKFLPNRCTACALNQAMSICEGGPLLCRHGVRLDQEDCDVGC